MKTDPDGGVTETITVALTTAGGATLGGTLTLDVDWSTGRATYSDLTVDTAATYTLTATEGGTGLTVTDGVSGSLDITP